MTKVWWLAVDNKDVQTEIHRLQFEKSRWSRLGDGNWTIYILQTHTIEWVWVCEWGGNRESSNLLFVFSSQELRQIKELKHPEAIIEKYYRCIYLFWTSIIVIPKTKNFVDILYILWTQQVSRRHSQRSCYLKEFFWPAHIVASLFFSLKNFNIRTTR